ncbi:MAG TPA: TauD/TfdA family dioxygenase [Thermoanaerobaculia bacterium]|jgi:alpha-ketoglutarate-dependent taurine dioxygenase|nr:TauD/TfdA family dioxygenase [Thermoanaerobaculia bacterium]
MEPNKPAPSKFFRVAPKAMSAPQGDLVTMKPLFADQRLPLVIEPAVPDLDAAEWAKRNSALVERKLLEHGGLLFRGFDVPSTAAFERFAEWITPHLADDNGELPRSNISGRIYSVSYAPPEQAILWHNENSFCPQWPMKLWFYCLLPAQEGGETPIVDNRLVLERLDPEVRESFRSKGIVYLRNLGRGLDFPWQVAFQTDDRMEVERRCREAGIEFEWKANDVLHTRSVRPAVLRHPKTGEEVFFAQPMLWHVNSYQAKADLRTFFRIDDLPRHCAYGDGSPISDEVIRHVYDVYRRSETVFPWQKGDALLLDNMLTAHARNPFAGPRKIYAAMAEQISDQDLQ